MPRKKKEAPTIDPVWKPIEDVPSFIEKLRSEYPLTDHDNDVLSKISVAYIARNIEIEERRFECIEAQMDSEQWPDHINYPFDGHAFVYDIMDVYIRSIPLIKWDLPLNAEEFSVFLTSYTYYYRWIVDIINTRLRNVTAIDVKWYNTYGKSKNYAIGDEEEIINTINLTIRFDMWFIPGTDTINVVEKIKYFIKEEIERLNETGVNYVHISNLMRKIELNFAAVDHIRFININNYPTTYQSVKVLVEDVNDLEKRERMIYVPEMLTVDLDNIIINEYVIDSY